MTIFHVIKYPLSDPISIDEYHSLPPEIKVNACVSYWGNKYILYAYVKTEKFRKILTQAILEYDDIPRN